MKKLVAVTLCALFAVSACKKKKAPEPEPEAEGEPAAAAPPPPLSAQPVRGAPPIPTPNDEAIAKARPLINEASFAKYLAFHKAQMKGFVPGMPPDPARRKAVVDAALAEAGLTEVEQRAMGPVIGAYYSVKMREGSAQNELDRLRKKIESQRASGQEPIPQDVAREQEVTNQVTTYEAARASWDAKLGPDLLGLLAKNEGEFRRAGVRNIRPGTPALQPQPQPPPPAMQ